MLLLLGILLGTTFPFTHAQSDIVSSVFDRTFDDLVKESHVVQESHLAHYPSIPDIEQTVHHDNGPVSGYLALRSNFIIDLAVFLNVKSVEDFEFGDDEHVRESITGLIANVCPVDSGDTCKDYDPQYRPYNNFCNNRHHPRWGNPKVAQQRLAKAQWENGGLVKYQLKWAGFLTPVEPIGCQLLPNDVMVFHLQGNTGFRLTVLSPEKRCDKIQVDSEGMVPGHIVYAKPVEKQHHCKEGESLRVYGNTVTVDDECHGWFEVCYQSPHIEIDLFPDVGQTNTIKVDGMIQSSFVNRHTLFSSHDFRLFWVKDKHGYIVVGTGSEHETGNVLLTGNTHSSNNNALCLSPYHRQSLSVSPLPGPDEPEVNVAFSVRDIVLLETDTSTSRSKTLDDFPFVWDNERLRFGIHYFSLSTNTYYVDIYDNQQGVRVTLTLGYHDSGVEYFVAGKSQGRVKIELSLVKEQTQCFVDKNDDTHRKYWPFWVSWLGNIVYVGAGNTIAKNPIARGLNLNLDYTFTPDQIFLRSKHKARWLLDIIQWNVPRATSISGRSLPSPRDITLAVHTDIDQPTRFSSHLTLAMMQMGQFLDHDVILTPTEEGPGGEILLCCEDGKYIHPQSRFCFNINVTNRTDPNGSQGKFPHPEHQCIGFARSSVVLECNFGQGISDLRSREQPNLLTSFVDGSHIYGSESDMARFLRAGPDHTGARLATSDEERELPTNSNAFCYNDANPTFQCHAAGDGRVSEQPGLTSMHALWMREHNRIVDALVLHHGYPETTEEEREVLYQEARRIVIAEYQNVIYAGFLKSFMDAEIHSQFMLGTGQCDYDSRINPGMINEWGIIHRMGHSLIYGKLIGLFNLQEHFFDPSIVHVNGSDVLIRDLFQSRCSHADRYVDEAVTENLFRVGNEALDLVSLNIQRGRCHGVTYCNLREALQLPVPATFEEAQSIGLFPAEAVELFKSVYDTFCDLDLFTGMLSERPLNQRDPDSRSPFGETVNVVQAVFFHRAKCGDRYWYEFPKAEFTEEQKAAIQGVTLSRIICDNTAGVDIIQKDAFTVESSANPRVSCDDTFAIPYLDLSLFPRPEYPNVNEAP